MLWAKPRCRLECLIHHLSCLSIPCLLQLAAIAVCMSTGAVCFKLCRYVLQVMLNAHFLDCDQYRDYAACRVACRRAVSKVSAATSLFPQSSLRLAQSGFPVLSFVSLADRPLPPFRQRCLASLLGLRPDRCPGDAPLSTEQLLP